MAKTLQWRVLTIIAVAALSVLMIYPPNERIRLGLDLAGGIHMVLQVETEEALQDETDTAARRLREQLLARGITGPTVVEDGSTTIRVEGVPPARASEFRRLTEELLASAYDRVGHVDGTYVLTMRPAVERALRDDALRQAIQTIQRRVNALGVSEPVVVPYSAGKHQLLVQLPGVADTDRARDIIQSTARLELKLVEKGPAPSRELLLEASNGEVPSSLELVTGSGEMLGSTPTDTAYYLVRRVAAVTGRDLRTARPTLDEFNRPAVSFSLHQEGGQVFAELTERHVGRSLAIILDGQVVTAPVIEGRISGDGQIAGQFTQQEATDLALLLRSGALPTSLTYLEQGKVSASLGAASIRAGVIASGVGLVSVATFMLAYYRLAGLNAILVLSLNLLMLLAGLVYLDAALTLPGIAGLLLTIGIGVDSNVLIFERIKEELKAGRSARVAVRASFDRVFLTILDTHVASLVAAALLFQFGSEPIKGFATILFLGLGSNVFTAVFASRTLFDVMLARGHEKFSI